MTMALLVALWWQQAFLGIGPQLGGGREADNFRAISQITARATERFHHGRGCSTSAIRWSLRQDASPRLWKLDVIALPWRSALRHLRRHLLMRSCLLPVAPS